MNNIKSILCWFLTAACLAILAACGGSTSDTSGPGGSALTQGKAVDPYIVGAIFQEVTPDGTILQRESTPSDAEGNFSFPRQVTPGSIIEMKVGSRGIHNGVPFDGILRRKVEPGAGGVLVASPLTTLIANGAAPAEVLSSLAAAGLPGMTAADLVADPMAGLADLRPAQVSDGQLRNLRAAMAVNAYFHLLNDYRAGALELSRPANQQLLGNLIEATGEALNVSTLNQLAGALAADPSLADHPMLLTDAIRLAADSMLDVAQLADAGAMPSSSMIQNAVHDAMAGAEDVVRGYMVARIEGGLPAPDPAPAPQPDPEPVPADGSALFTATCALCHNLGVTGTRMDLAGDGALIAGKFPGHNGINLTVAEIAALATFVNDQAPAPVPAPSPAPPDGTALYAGECQGCHGSLATTTVRARTAAGILEAIAGNRGGMGGIILSQEQAQSIASVLPAPAPAPAPAPTPVDGKTVYDVSCATCHLLGTYDGSGFAPDLAGKSQLIAAKTAGGHAGGPFPAETLTALTSFVAAQTPAPAPAPTPAPTPVPAPTDCTSCHGQPPAGSTFPNTAGAHAAHQALPGIGTNCAVCHQGAGHNGAVDFGFPAIYNAKTGAAAKNSDDTCSNVSCHGGKATPVWGTGSLDVTTQCTSCHASGTTQYNSYNSGRHSKHSRYACTVCHEVGKLAADHFTSLGTTALEGPAGATIGGGTTRVTSYNRTSRSCLPSCHGSENW